MTLAARIFGDRPARTLVRLIIISFIVGFILVISGFDPFDVWDTLVRFVNYLASLGFFEVRRVLHYIVTGAIIVLPIWLVLRLLSGPRRG